MASTPPSLDVAAPLDTPAITAPAVDVPVVDVPALTAPAPDVPALTVPAVDDATDDSSSAEESRSAEAEGEVDVEPTAPKRVNKPRKGNQLTTNTYVITRVNQFTGAPISPQRAAKKWSNTCGCVVRENVRITCEDWGKLPDAEKAAAMTELFNRFVVPEADKELVTKHAGIVMGACLRTWRYVANKDFVEKKKDYAQVRER
jgi:hypothetical protein